MWAPIIANIVAGVGAMIGKSLAKRAAFKTLLKGGMLPAGMKYNSKAAQTLLKKIGSGKKASGVFRLQDYMKGGSSLDMGTRARGVFGKGSLGAIAARGGHYTDLASGRALRLIDQAAHRMQGAKAWGAAEKIIGGSVMAEGGYHMLSGMDSMWERNIPVQEREMLQTQQQFMPRQAYTQRQRAIQAIHQSQMTTRSALGNEAQFMHG